MLTSSEQSCWPQTKGKAVDVGTMILEATVKKAAEIRQGNDEMKQKFLAHYCGKITCSLRRQRNGSFSLARPKNNLSLFLALV
jgi:hypothetical protein